MGGCATKPKVLNDGVQKPVAPPPEEEKVVVKEVEKDASLPTFEESPTKNPSLGNLFNKEREETRMPQLNEAGKACISEPVSQEAESSKSREEPPPEGMTTQIPEEQLSTKVPQVVHSNATTEDSANVLAPVIVSNSPPEKEALKDPEFVPVEYKDASDKLPAPVEEEEAVKAQGIVSVESTESLEKNNTSEELKTAHDNVEKIKETVEEKIVIHEQIIEASVENKSEEVTEMSEEKKPERDEMKAAGDDIAATEKKQTVVAEEISLTQLIDLKVQSGDETSVHDEPVEAKSDK